MDKKSNAAPPAPKVASPQPVRVKVVGQPVAEDCGRFEKGDEFETTPERAQALGGLVEVVSGEGSPAGENQ